MVTAMFWTSHDTEITDADSTMAVATEASGRAGPGTIPQVDTASYQRLPDDSSTTGALSAADSYTVAAVLWYDGIGRVVASANFGRQDVGSGLTHYIFDGITGELIHENEYGIPEVAEDSPPEPLAVDPNPLAGIDFQLQLTEYDAMQAFPTSSVEIR